MSSLGHTPRICTVILNWNQPSMTIDCARAVLSQEVIGRQSVVVVDNGSSPENRDELIAGLPTNCRLIRNSRNLGFAGGMNVGISLAIEDGFEFVWLMNNDAFPEVGCLAALVEAMDADSTLAAVTPELSSPDGSPQFVGGRLDWLTGEQTLVSAGEIPYPTPIGVCAIGTALLLRTSVLRTVGGFDERFFAYREEDDLCTRIVRLGGWNLRDVAAAKCVHLGSESTGGHRSAFMHHLMVRNGFLLLCKHLPWRWLFAAYLRNAASQLRRAVGLARCDPRSANAVVGGIWGAITNSYGFPKKLFPPRWVQKIALSRGWGLSRILISVAEQIAPPDDGRGPFLRAKPARGSRGSRSIR